MLPIVEKMYQTETVIFCSDVRFKALFISSFSCFRMKATSRFEHDRPPPIGRPAYILDTSAAFGPCGEPFVGVQFRIQESAHSRWHRLAWKCFEGYGSSEVDYFLMPTRRDLCSAMYNSRAHIYTVVKTHLRQPLTSAVSLAANQ